MYSVNKTLIYFLIFTLIGGVVAYKLVMASFESYDYIEAQESISD